MSNDLSNALGSIAPIIFLAVLLLFPTVAVVAITAFIVLSFLFFAYNYHSNKNGKKVPRTEK